MLYLHAFLDMERLIRDTLTDASFALGLHTRQSGAQRSVTAPDYIGSMHQAMKHLMQESWATLPPSHALTPTSQMGRMSAEHAIERRLSQRAEREAGGERRQPLWNFFVTAFCFVA